MEKPDPIAAAHRFRSEFPNTNDMFEVAALRGYFIFRKREEVRYPAYSIDPENKIIYLYCRELTTLRENVLICKAFG